jgi:hypothetical protein
MTVCCIDCSNFTFGREDTDEREMARHGFGKCGPLPQLMYVGARYPRRCDAFHPADAEIVGNRVAWLESKTYNAKVSGGGLPPSA